jgi:hypothetical protein
VERTARCQGGWRHPYVLPDGPYNHTDVPTLLWNHCERSMIVAVIAMRMMQAPVHEIIDMVAVRHCLMAAIRLVKVFRVVALRVMPQIAPVRIHLVHGNHVLISMASRAMLQATIRDIIHMVFVLDGGMAAAGAMNMR